MSAVACQFPNNARFVMGAISELETRDNSVATGDASRFKYRVLPYQFVLQDHNYGAPPPPTPPQSPPPHPEDDPAPDEDTNTSVVTSTTNEEDTVEQSITRCICEFDHDDEYMICCDRCSVWQHVACMGLDRESIPETYLCERCQPRRVDRQKAKNLQNRKRRKLTKCGSEESADGHQYRNQNNRAPTANGNGPNATAPATLPGSGRSALKRRRKNKESTAKTFEGSTKTVPAVRGSGAPTIRRRKMREKENRKAVPRKKIKRKSVEMNLIDEDARDSWESSLRERIDKYEDAVVNQYSPELLSYMPKMRVNGAREDGVRQSVVENLRVQRCRVSQVAKNSKGLVASEEIDENQVICECRGKIQLLSQFHGQTPLGNLRPVPYVMVYSIHKDQESVCVDARNFGNDSRFIRRSCTPNAEVKHILDNGNLRLYFASCKKIRKNEEITIAFDAKHEGSEETVQCACAMEYCATILGTKRNWLAEMSVDGKKRSSATEEDTASQSDNTEDPQNGVDRKTVPKAPSGPSGNGVDSAEAPPCPDAPAKGDEDTHAADKKKMTREERKMEAIMKAFARLEKAEQRRQEVMSRMAQKKDDGHQRRRSSGEGSNATPSNPQGDEKPEGVAASNNIESESAPAVVSPPAPVAEVAAPTVEEHAQATPPACSASCTAANEVTAALPVAEVPTVVAAQQPHRPRLKGRRRRTSGTPGRRQARTLSGGSSEVPSADETSQPQLTPLPLPMVTSALQSPLASAQPLPEPEGDAALTATGTVTAMALSKKLLKTKKHLMNEWLSGESSDVRGTTATTSLNLNLKLEITPGIGAIGDTCATASPTCYVRCSKSPSGISTAHLRRASVGESNSKCNSVPDSSLGSAKKRWLRQAMCEDTEVSAVVSGVAPVTCDAASPSLNCSPSTPPLQDLVTPLKKRRLARESDTATPPSTPPPPHVPVASCETAVPDRPLVAAAEAAEAPADKDQLEIVVKQECVAVPMIVTQCARDEKEEADDCAEESGEQKVKEVVKMEAEERTVVEILTAVEVLDIPLPDEKPPKREEEETRTVDKETPAVDKETRTVDKDLDEEMDSKPSAVEPDVCPVTTETAKIDRCEVDSPKTGDGIVEVLESGGGEESVAGKADDIIASSPPQVSECDGGEKEVTDSKGGFAGDDCPSPSLSSVPSPVKSPNSTPQTTPTKRKVSLLEYRKRKLEFQSTSVSAPPASCPNTTTPLLAEFPANSPLQLSTLPLFANVTSPDKSTDDKGTKGDRLREPQEEVRWGGKTNPLDQQRENLTERLKREFGLVTDDETAVADASESEDLADIPPPPPPLPPPPPPSHPPPMATVYAAAARPSTSSKHGFPVFTYVACQVGNQFELPPPPPPPLPVSTMPRAGGQQQAQQQQQQRIPVRTMSHPLLQTPSPFLSGGGQTVVMEAPGVTDNCTRSVDPRPRGMGRYPTMSSSVPSPSPSSSSSASSTSLLHAAQAHASNGVPPLPRHPVQGHAAAKGYFAPNYFK